MNASLRNGGANLCTIWDVSRARGIGYEAEPYVGGNPAPCDTQFVDPICSGEPYLRLGSFAFARRLRRHR